MKFINKKNFHWWGLISGFVCFCSFVSTSKDDFDIEMGCNTKHWSYVQQPEDIADLAIYRALFYKNCSRIHEEHQGFSKIPQAVHFIWLGPRPFPPQSVANVRSWIAKHPGWTFKFWTDRPRAAPCHGMETIVFKEYPFPYLGRCYTGSHNWGEKSDILRYEILFQEGGVYVDHDANCLASFEPYNKAYEFYCGLETPHPPFVGRNITANNGLLGSCPGHAVIRKTIDLVNERWDAVVAKFIDNDEISKNQIVMERTYIAFTDALRSALDIHSDSQIVFPASYLFAKKGIKPVLSKHFFANTWATTSVPNVFEKETCQTLNKIEKRFDRLNYIQGGAFMLNLIIIFLDFLLIDKMRKT